MATARPSDSARSVVSAAVRTAEVAREATAVAPPTADVARRAPAPGPAAPGSRATETAKRPSVAAETSWPAALTRAEPRLPWKKRRIVAAREPGRGYGPSAEVTRRASPAGHRGPAA